MSTVDAHNPDLDQIPVLVHERLTRFLDARAAEVAAIGTPVTEAVEYLRNFVLNGGKRIRPLYVWAGFVAAQGPDESAENIESVLDAAASLEFIQACALIHDDIIDSSDTRRGAPTVHRAVEQRHGETGLEGDAAHFGQSVAILAGDMALVWAEDMLQDSGLSAEALARTRDAWRGMRTEVIGGQLLDIFLEAQANESVDLADSVNRFKTAAYTIERPLHLGASIAGADDELITALRNYGRDIGIAFQLRDDLLGVFGDPAITGKPAGDDIREGKRTVLLSLALQQADISDPDASAVIRAGIGKVSDPVEISRIAGLIRETGAEDQVEQRITALTESGLAHLDLDSIPEGVRKQLRHLAIRATERRM
ncbi:(2E,6E)-farnesyl diphosphate synthase [Corynebacterium faecale]|uniref:polyprenyl synthetase family protein n=1 Tax=Corynebacterium faecale TaxID=1758466 RepID=UPI0025B3081A|nr:polyprenyl synthetase family protein [Corynebacterium faecale]WJY92697.1 (2E,6E)-farnesyl diphosphate synthase [Corynebacterium faecale]